MPIVRCQTMIIVLPGPVTFLNVAGGFPRGRFPGGA